MRPKGGGGGAAAPTLVASRLRHDGGPSRLVNVAEGVGVVKDDREAAVAADLREVEQVRAVATAEPAEEFVLPGKEGRVLLQREVKSTLSHRVGDANGDAAGQSSR